MNKVLKGYMELLKAAETLDEIMEIGRDIAIYLDTVPAEQRDNRRELLQREFRLNRVEIKEVGTRQPRTTENEVIEELEMERGTVDFSRVGDGVVNVMVSDWFCRQNRLRSFMTGHIIHQTQKAILFRTQMDDFDWEGWLPISQARVLRPDGEEVSRGRLSGQEDTNEEVTVSGRGTSIHTVCINTPTSRDDAIRRIYDNGEFVVNRSMADRMSQYMTERGVIRTIPAPHMHIDPASDAADRLATGISVHNHAADAARYSLQQCIQRVGEYADEPPQHPTCRATAPRINVNISANAKQLSQALSTAISGTARLGEQFADRMRSALSGITEGMSGVATQLRRAQDRAAFTGRYGRRLLDLASNISMVTPSSPHEILDALESISRSHDLNAIELAARTESLLMQRSYGLERAMNLAAQQLVEQSLMRQAESRRQEEFRREYLAEWVSSPHDNLPMEEENDLFTRLRMQPGFRQMTDFTIVNEGTAMVLLLVNGVVKEYAVMSGRRTVLNERQILERVSADSGGRFTVNVLEMLHNAGKLLIYRPMVLGQERDRNGLIQKRIVWATPATGFDVNWVRHEGTYAGRRHSGLAIGRWMISPEIQPGFSEYAALGGNYFVR
jgi:hypothetical protein